MSDQIKVLYIAGWGRSGTTILDNILGQYNGLLSTGEIRYIWQRGLLENRLCGCGTPLRECTFWRNVLDPVVGNDQAKIEYMAYWTENGLRSRHIPMLVFPGVGNRLISRIDTYRYTLASLYQEVKKRSESQVIVDSSKFPTYGYILDSIPNIDLYVVHMVRDPRAVAYSWIRKKEMKDRGSNKYMRGHSPIESTFFWLLWNSTIEALWKKNGPEKYILLRYEDFVQDPKGTTEHILDMVGVSTQENTPFVDQNTVKLSPTHTVSGNPSRFSTGEVKIKPDDEWKEKLDARSKLLITSLAMPMMHHYGYLNLIILVIMLVLMYASA